MASAWRTGLERRKWSQQARAAHLNNKGTEERSKLARKASDRHWLFRHFNQYGEDVEIVSGDDITLVHCGCATVSFTPVQVNGGASHVKPDIVLNPETTPFPVKTALVAAMQKGAKFFRDASGHKGIRFKDESYAIRVEVNPGHEHPAGHCEIDSLYGYEKRELMLASRP